MNAGAARTLFQEGALGLRLIWKLSSYLKETISPAQTKQILQFRLQNRENDFLELIKKCIFDNPDSPYIPLLKHAGCEFGDVQRLVNQEGLEGALHTLFRQGVYLTTKEFRGDKEIIRGNTCLRINPQKLRNPFTKLHLPVRSAGSRSHGTQVVRDMAYVYDNTFDLVAYLEARQSILSDKGYWAIPGGVALSCLIKFNTTGAPPNRWFSQLNPHGPELTSRYRLSTRILNIAGRFAGVPMPSPEYVSLEDPFPIIQWIQQCLQQGRTPHLYTFASSAVRLAQYAIASNISLKGVHITMSGEPSTPARLQTVRSTQAEAFPTMGCVETGTVGYGCITPEAPDDMHLGKDLHAVIQPGKSFEGTELKPLSLLFTTLRLSSPLILLNISMGDQAVLKNRACGCLQGEIGLDTHLHSVRSFEKLTSGGMAFLDTEIIQVLEVDLPKLFGGGPTDYQLIEGEDKNGKPHLRLLVHPHLGPLDETQVKQAFLEKIGSEDGADKLTSLIWHHADMISIERTPPKTTSTGKIQHMHIEQ